MTGPVGEEAIPRALPIHALHAVKGPDPATKPDYENISSPLGKELDRLFLKMFRSRFAANLGVDSSLPQVSASSGRTLWFKLASYI